MSETQHQSQSPTQFSESFEFRSIGTLRTSFGQKFGTPRQGELVPNSRGHLVLERKYWDQGFFSELSGFSHAWLLSVFHLHIGNKVNGKVTPPRLERAVGVFATRSPHRPNPIGLTAVKLLEVAENEIWVGGVDLVDNTPIVDVKPYIPEDHVNAPKFGWIGTVAKPDLMIEWACSPAEMHMLNERQRELVKETLALNPLPLIYRPMEDKRYWLRVEEFDICFMSSPVGFKILGIKSLALEPGILDVL
jgi:tRNA-Thr(GGU) m(6)t(6)A37 methyltransferase TsaA